MEKKKRVREKRERRSKYHNKRVEYDGQMFDSKAECQYYIDLQEKKQKGEIADFRCQVPFTLQDGYPDPLTGRRIRPIIYQADFVVQDNQGKEKVIDVKGSRGIQTEVFKLKKKLFEFKYKRPLYIVVMKNGKKECSNDL